MREHPLVKWRVLIIWAAVAIGLYITGAIILGSLGIDVHWRGSH